MNTAALFLRLLPHDDKAAALAEAVAAVRAGRMLNPVVHTVDPASFRQVPGSTFAYWVSERIRRKFIELPPFESQGRQVRVGDHPGDGFRYLRLFWEVPIGPSACDWRPYQKGGEYSPYYYDIHLVADWDASRQTYRGFYGRPGRPNERPSNYQYFFRAGLTWPRRTQRGLSIRVHPAGCVFADKEPVIFADNDSFASLLGLTNSVAFHGIVTLQMAFGSFEVGVIQRTPVPELSGPQGVKLGKIALHCVNIKQDLDRANETSHVFHLLALLQVSSDTLAERLAAWQAWVAKAEQRLAEYQREIDDIAFRLYGIEGDDRRAIEEVVSGQLSVASSQLSESSEEESETKGEKQEVEIETTTNARGLVADLLSYAFGCSFGRWEVRFATGERQAPELPDPFAPLPVCSPGMLTGDDGLPLRETPADYPLQIDWDGILVDDPDHPDDIIRRVREVLEIIWGERADAIEREACDILGVKELRDYFRKPGNGGFWMDHIRRYSKSRRKAPIYWLLQSSRKNYALWIYYHRLDKDILFKALLNYVEPKIRLEESRIDSLRSRKQAAGDSGKAIKNLDKDIERQEDLLSELRDFEDKLRRAANLHLEPDLNDGVVLNIAPLHELVPWKEAKNYWEELLTGKYEWSSIGKQLREKGMVR